MNFRALLRRAFPYIVIGIGGFALAYVVTFVFVLPTGIVPPAPQSYVPDSSKALAPIDTGSPEPLSSAPIEPSPVPARIIPQPEPSQPPVPAPDLIGMSLADARALLERTGLRAIVTHDTSSFQPPNTILRQSPAADSLVSAGGAVTLIASYFPPDSTSDTMRVQRDSTVPRIRPSTDPLRRPDTLHSE